MQPLLVDDSAEFIPFHEGVLELGPEPKRASEYSPWVGKREDREEEEQETLSKKYQPWAGKRCKRTKGDGGR